MAYLLGGAYDTTNFRRHLVEKGKSPSTAIIYSSLVNIALRTMPDASPSSLNTYMMGVKDKNFPAAWKAFVPYARGRGLEVADWTVRAKPSLVFEPRDHPCRKAIVRILQLAAGCYYDLHTTALTLSVFPFNAPLHWINRYGRDTRKELTGCHDTIARVWTDQEGALRSILQWGWGIETTKDCSDVMLASPLIPTYPKSPHAVVPHDLAELVFAEGDERLARKIAVGVRRVA